MTRTILHIDMNSYFATVEQQANPLLRGKPIAVSGRPNIQSVVATASYEAKKYGVKSGMNTWEAKKLCPFLIFIPGDPNKYIDITGRLIKIFKSYTPLVEIFSIDEVFLDLSHASSRAQEIALEIKVRIRREIGDKMTCSIGVASNKFLAKLASEKKKPDGLTIVTPETLDEILLSSKLDDFCGIGRRILARLSGMGIYTVAQLRKVPREFLVAAFGNVCGNHLHDMAFGFDDSPVVPDFEADEQKSFGHSLTLPTETDDRAYVEAVLLRLAEKVARRLRAENFAGRLVHLYIRFPNLGGVGEQKALGYYVDDGYEIFGIGREILNKSLPSTDYRLLTKIRMLSIGVGSLVKKDLLTSSLLPEKQRAEKIVSSMDLVNNHFGENTIFRAAVLPAFEREKNVAGIRIKLRFQ